MTSGVKSVRVLIINEILYSNNKALKPLDYRREIDFYGFLDGWIFRLHGVEFRIFDINSLIRRVKTRFCPPPL